MNELVLPGYYKLVSAVLTTYAGKSLEISGLIPVFSIEESINKDSIRGSATIIDATNLLDDLPLRGEETLKLVIEDALKQKNEYTFRIYKVDDVAISATNDTLTYRIHFVSASSFDAMFRRIIEPFDDKISAIAEQIFARYYPGVSKDLVLEETVGLFRCVIPNYTAPQTMNFLANRAFSTQSPSCSFRFFETAENYFFASDEYLIGRFLENKDLIKEFIFSDAIEKSGEQFIAQMQNIIELENAERVNTVTDLISGSYRSKVIEIDLTRRRVTMPAKSEENEYIYENERDKYRITASQNSTDSEVHTQQFVQDYFTEENERRYIIVKDYSEDGTSQLRGEQFLPEIVANRTAYRSHLGNTPVRAKINGRFDLSAGDVINLKIPDFGLASGKQDLNKRLSGYYFVEAVTHVFERDIHSTLLHLLKYDWETTE
jgi:hypothetical protein